MGGRQSCRSDVTSAHGETPGRVQGLTEILRRILRKKMMRNSPTLILDKIRYLYPSGGPASSILAHQDGHLNCVYSGNTIC